MSEEVSLEAFETTLDHAVQKMQVLEVRLRTGEVVSQDEIDSIAKQVANELEEALDVLKDLLGSEDELAAPLGDASELNAAPGWMSTMEEAEVPTLRAGEAGAI